MFLLCAFFNVLFSFKPKENFKLLSKNRSASKSWHTKSTKIDITINGNLFEIFTSSDVSTFSQTTCRGIFRNYAKAKITEPEKKYPFVFFSQQIAAKKTTRKDKRWKYLCKTCELILLSISTFACIFNIQIDTLKN